MKTKRDKFRYLWYQSKHGGIEIECVCMCVWVWVCVCERVRERWPILCWCTNYGEFLRRRKKLSFHHTVLCILRAPESLSKYFFGAVLRLFSSFIFSLFCLYGYNLCMKRKTNWKIFKIGYPFRESTSFKKPPKHSFLLLFFFSAKKFKKFKKSKMAKYVKGGKEEKVSKRPKEYFDQYPNANNLVLPLIHRISLNFEQAMISLQGMAEF